MGIDQQSAALAIALIRDLLGESPTLQQRAVIRSVWQNRRTACKAGTGVGKTRAAAMIAITWLLMGPDRIVVTTAPTNRQVKQLLWKEIRSMLAAAKERGYPIGELKPVDCDFRLGSSSMIGFSSDEGVNFQGFHSPGGTLFLLDEAPGISGPIWDAIDGTLTGTNDRILAIGNPVTPSGRFFDMFRSEVVSKITISGLSSPNVVTGTEVVPGMIGREWLAERREEWGEDSALWKARVLGEFPDLDDDAIVPLAWIEAAMQPKSIGEITKIDIGADVARKGQDKTVFAIARHTSTGVHVELQKHQGKTTMEVAGLLTAMQKQLNAAQIKVDADGLGAGVYDRLVELGVPTSEIRGGRAANNPTRFVNARSEWIWSVRERLSPANPTLWLPDDPALLHQLSTLRYTIDSAGRIAVEKKADWAARTGRSSPDELDAVAYALAITQEELRNAKFWTL